MIDAERIKALSVLGYNFWLHLFRSLLPREKKDQAELFLSYFRDDRIANFTPEEYREIDRFEACVVCGLCPGHCRVMEEAPGRFFGPMHLAACASRSQPEFIADRDSLLLCAACGQCEPVCPEAVPVARVATAMRDMIWRVAAELLPPAYHTAAENLAAHGNIFGPASVPAGSATGAALVLGPRLRRMPDSAANLVELLRRLGLPATPVAEGSIGGEARSLGLLPDTAWVDALAASSAATIFVADPEAWLCLAADPRLKQKTVQPALLAAIEKWPAGAKLPPGPVAVHDGAAFGRRSPVAARVREFLAAAGATVVEMDRPGESAPPVGWEGGIELVDPELAGRLAARRLADARRAGARILLALSADDYALLSGQKVDGVEVVFIFDLLGRAAF